MWSNKKHLFSSKVSFIFVKYCSGVSDLKPQFCALLNQRRADSIKVIGFGNNFLIVELFFFAPWSFPVVKYFHSNLAHLKSQLVSSLEYDFCQDNEL